MKNLSKLVTSLLIFVLLGIYYLMFSVGYANAQVPGLKFPCDKVDDPEFHSLRPYQASPCGDANKALYCSNDLIFLETFDNFPECENYSGPDGPFLCPVNHHVKKHNLLVELDDSMLPILGNTELLTNSQTNSETLNDAQKMNEYASWYLNGVINRAEYGSNKNTASELVNFSGPVNKLMPSTILEAQRIETIKKASEQVTVVDEITNESNKELETHNQIVVCSDSNIPIIGNLLGLGKIKPIECYKGGNSNAQGKVERLSSWEEDLSFWNSYTNDIVDLISGLLPDVARNMIEESIGDHWNKRTPPLPWSNMENKPFEKDVLYRKAYNEWKGKTCVLIPVFDFLICFENIFVPNKYADLYPYIPLGITPDKKGSEAVTNVIIQPIQPTLLSSHAYDQVRNAPLYFAHTQETKNLIEFFNKHYTPFGLESTDLPKTVEVNDASKCSVVNVRVNQGDDLFPGDPDEIQVEGVEYTISQVPCNKSTERELVCNGIDPCYWEETVTITCNAEVKITLKTKTKSPWVKEIFDTSVANSGSTFRKIFPKVEKGAPVECIANIPAKTNVTYTAQDSLSGGSWQFKYKNPVEGSGGASELYFPHLGSVYEYFLKGIQTALRPKGYGDPLVNGELCETEEEQDMCPVVEDSKVPEKYLGEYKTNYLSKADAWTTSCSGSDNNLAEECYNYVVSESQEKGVNPAFSLTMWLEESGSSNYCFLEQMYGAGKGQDFGINRSDVPSQNIVKQLAAFIDLAKEKLCSGTSGFVQPIHGWLTHFRSTDYAKRCDPTDPCGYAYTYGGSCTVDGMLKDYGGIINIWQIVNNTISGNCINNGRFAIDWPTSMSCP